MPFMVMRLFTVLETTAGFDAFPDKSTGLLGFCPVYDTQENAFRNMAEGDILAEVAFGNREVAQTISE